MTQGASAGTICGTSTYRMTEGPVVLESCQHQCAILSTEGSDSPFYLALCFSITVELMVPTGNCSD